MNLFLFFPLAIGFFVLVRQPVLEKKNSELKLVVPRVKTDPLHLRYDGVSRQSEVENVA